MFSAYTVKKVLPRLILAVVAINLSYYIVIIAIDITNLIGDGIIELMLKPFGNMGWSPGNLSSAIMGIGLAIGAFFAFRAIIRQASKTKAQRVGGLQGFKNLSKGAGAALGHFMLAVVVPIVLIVLAILITLAIRLGLMVALALASPLAFAAFVLPGTEKWFKKWMELFGVTLMIYPIVMAMIALGRVMTYIFGNTTGNTIGGLTGVMAVISQFIPLAMIPFSFKLAGGALAGIGNFMTGHAGGSVKQLIQGSKDDPDSRINWAKRKHDLAKFSRKEAAISAMDGFSNRRKSRVGKLLGRSMARSYGDLAYMERKRARINKEDAELAAFTNTGPDSTLRALSVNKRYAMAHNNDTPGNPLWRWKDGVENGEREFRTLGGGWVKESAIDAAHRAYGGDQAMLQRALTYEIGKASTETDNELVNQHFPAIARSFGLNEEQAQSVMTGSGYEMQQRSLQYKHTKIKDGTATVDHDKLTEDWYYNKASYGAAQLNAQSWRELGAGYDDAVGQLNSGVDTKTGQALTADRRAELESRRDRVMEIARDAGTPTQARGEDGGLESSVATTAGASATNRAIAELREHLGMNPVTPAAPAAPPRPPGAPVGLGDDDPDD